MDTGIFRMIAGGKLTLGLGKVKRASVGFGRTRYNVDDKRYYRGNVS